MQNFVLFFYTKSIHGQYCTYAVKGLRPQRIYAHDVLKTFPGGTTCFSCQYITFVLSALCSVLSAFWLQLLSSLGTAKSEGPIYSSNVVELAVRLSRIIKSSYCFRRSHDPAEPGIKQDSPLSRKKLCHIIFVTGKLAHLSMTSYEKLMTYTNFFAAPKFYLLFSMIALSQTIAKELLTPFHPTNHFWRIILRFNQEKRDNLCAVIWYPCST